MSIKMKEVTYGRTIVLGNGRGFSADEKSWFGWTATVESEEEAEIVLSALVSLADKFEAEERRAHEERRRR